MSSHPRRHRATARRQGRRRAEDQAAFLSTLTGLLAGSLDLETTLATIAAVALPHPGAWCIVDLVEDGHPRRVAVVHAEPAMQLLARQLESGWPPQRDDPLGGPRVMRTRVSEVVTSVTPAMLAAVASSAGVHEALVGLGIGSLIAVPLLGREDVLGALTYVSPVDGHSFDAGDVAFAEAVAERAAQAIDNARQYAQSQRAATAAAEANRAKIAFLATLSHELRTPLNAIGGYAQLLAEGVRGPLTRPQRAAVLRIRANERHLLGLVDAVLGYARVDSGRTHYDLENVPVSVVFADVDAIIGPLASAKGVPFELVEAPPPPHVVHADRGRFCQILVNLINNAVKFSRRGAPVIVASSVHGHAVLVTVADRGIGLDAAQLAGLFEPFVQAHVRGTGGEEGTGLGLAISRRLAREMGGDLVAESRPGEGSTFTVSLPLAHGTAA